MKENINDNMLYLFKGDLQTMPDDLYKKVYDAHARAKKLEEHNGAIYPGLWSSAFYYCNKARVNGWSINVQEVEKLYKKILTVEKPDRRW